MAVRIIALPPYSNGKKLSGVVAPNLAEVKLDFLRVSVKILPFLIGLRFKISEKTSRLVVGI